MCIWSGILMLALTAGLSHAQFGGTDWFLNSLDLNFSQYRERMGLSLWAFDPDTAGTGLGSSSAVTARGRARIKAGKASVRYRPLAPTLAADFAASRPGDSAKRRDLIRTYDLFLGRFRDGQRRSKLGERDVAAALGLAFASYYEIYTGRVADASQERDIVKGFRVSLLKNPYFQGTNDRYRQLLDENTAVQTVAALVLYRNAVKRGDERGVAAGRREALAFLDFYWPGNEERARKIRLTPAGFRD